MLLHGPRVEVDNPQPVSCHRRRAHWQLLSDLRSCLVRKNFVFLATEAFWFLFDKYCLITE